MNLTLSTEKYNTNCYNLKSYGNDNSWKTVFRAAVRTKQTPEMDLLAEVVSNLKARNCFCKKFHLRCLTEPNCISNFCSTAWN